MNGPLWSAMNVRPRRAAHGLSGSDVPTAHGVYAWYRDDSPIYVGVAAGLEGVRGRVWKDHLSIGIDLSRSSFRRNVCELLGIAATARTSIRPSVMTVDQVTPVNDWIRSCEISWITCASAAAAADLESRMKHEWKPILTKR